MSEPKVGWAWVNKLHKKPILSVREIRRGRNKGKVEITLCNGRLGNGVIRPGKKLIIPLKWIMVLPGKVT
jgi:hypothetical protein